jgi:hypothetical protein
LEAVPSSVIDLDGGGHAGRNNDARRPRSICMRTGMRWARRAQVKIELTLATPDFWAGRQFPCGGRGAIARSALRPDRYAGDAGPMGGRINSEKQKALPPFASGTRKLTGIAPM